MKSHQMGYKLQEVKAVVAVTTNCSGHRIMCFCLHPMTRKKSAHSYLCLDRITNLLCPPPPQFQQGREVTRHITQFYTQFEAYLVDVVRVERKENFTL